MDLGFPHSIVSSRLDSEVLVTLARSTRPQTGSGIARLVRRGSRPGVNLSLQRLAEHGIVTMTQVGKANVYALNRDHVAMPVVEVLASLREILLDKIRGEVARWQIPPVHVSVFGSFARGDGNTGSDIDVFVVRSAGVTDEDVKWRDQVATLSQAIHSWSGNHAGVAEVSEDELPRLRDERPPVVEEIETQAITISGQTAVDLLSTR